MTSVTLKGAFSSPCTLKTRVVLRYRRIPYRWVLRGSEWDDLGRLRDAYGALDDGTLSGTGCDRLVA